MGFGVNVLSVGKTMVPGPEIFWMKEFGKWLPLNFNVVVIRGNNKTVLINTGISKTMIPVLNKMWVEEMFKSKDARLNVSEEEYIENALATLNIKPEDIDYVVVTPFQSYAIGNINLFKNATICISKKGWINFHAPRWKQHPHDIRQFCIPDENLLYLITEAWSRVKLLEDEDEIIKGVTTFWTGVHHRSSIAIKINSSEGTIIASDSFFYFENIESNWPIGINESIEESLIAYEKIKKEVDLLIPLYDPRVFERYTDGVVSSYIKS
jgi:glyoxylase-like metal-dependent hydrolase (beta-lactamase superfamily II)